MEIKIEDYLSDSDIKEICLEEIRNKVREELRYNQVSDVLSNISYSVVFKMVSEVMELNEDEMKQLITDKTISIINDLSSYCVFRRKDDTYTKNDSLAQTYANEAVLNNKELIEKRVKEIMISFSESLLSNQITDIVYEIVDKRLFAKEEE